MAAIPKIDGKESSEKLTRLQKNFMKEKKTVADFFTKMHMKEVITVLHFFNTVNPEYPRKMLLDNRVQSQFLCIAKKHARNRTSNTLTLVMQP